MLFQNASCGLALTDTARSADYYLTAINGAENDLYLRKWSYSTNNYVAANLNISGTLTTANLTVTGTATLPAHTHSEYVPKTFISGNSAVSITTSLTLNSNHSIVYFVIQINDNLITGIVPCFVNNAKYYSFGGCDDNANNVNAVVYATKMYDSTWSFVVTKCFVGSTQYSSNVGFVQYYIMNSFI
jgi:hypothetical protein